MKNCDPGREKLLHSITFDYCVTFISNLHSYFYFEFLHSSYMIVVNSSGQANFLLLKQAKFLLLADVFVNAIIFK